MRPGLICDQGILERTDEQLLPAVYNFVAAAFDASPEQLGYLTLARALVQAAASPLGGILGAPCVDDLHVTLWYTLAFERLATDGHECDDADICAAEGCFKITS